MYVWQSEKTELTEGKEQGVFLTTQVRAARKP